MIVYTDNIEYAERILGPGLSWDVPPSSFDGTDIAQITPQFFHKGITAVTKVDVGPLWTYLFIIEKAIDSQYDILIRLAQENKQIPHGLLCLAGTGKKLHGFKNRPWESVLGNLHLSAHLAPEQEIENFAVGFTILAAVSVLKTLDSIKGLAGRASLKWVNDILIENKKVSGVLAHTQSQGRKVTSAILGIGLNVEVTPEVPRDPFVPGVASLRDFLSHPDTCDLQLTFSALIRILEENYTLLTGRGYQQLLDLYRDRSIVLDREVIIHADSDSNVSTEPVSGVVTSIGPNLELYLSDQTDPVTRGRLVLVDLPEHSHR